MTQIKKQAINNALFWKLWSNDPITEETARMHQEQNGYAPAGYGFYRFQVAKELRHDGDHKTTEYLATWRCQASCD